MGGDKPKSIAVTKIGGVNIKVSGEAKSANSNVWVTLQPLKEKELPRLQYWEPGGRVLQPGEKPAEAFWKDAERQLGGSTVFTGGVKYIRFVDAKGKAQYFAIQRSADHTDSVLVQGDEHRVPNLHRDYAIITPAEIIHGEGDAGALVGIRPRLVRGSAVSNEVYKPGLHVEWIADTRAGSDFETAITVAESPRQAWSRPRRARGAPPVQRERRQLLKQLQKGKPHLIEGQSGIIHATGGQHEFQVKMDKKGRITYEKIEMSAT